MHAQLLNLNKVEPALTTLSEVLSCSFCSKQWIFEYSQSKDVPYHSWFKVKNPCAKCKGSRVPDPFPIQNPILIPIMPRSRPHILFQTLVLETENVQIVLAQPDEGPDQSKTSLVVLLLCNI